MLVVSMDPEYGGQAQIPQSDQRQSAAEEKSRAIIIQEARTAVARFSPIVR
ncbi:MAG: hypothetical protein WAM79_19710 [Candidatus Sulfotelmatobacter sp.]